MLIQTAVKLIRSIPNSWARVEHLRRIPGGLELCFGIHKGKRGKKAAGWCVSCLGVHEVEITDLDGGGLAAYPSTHPAAHQYVARQAEMRWLGSSNAAEVLATLYRAHAEAVDDWIPFGRYLLVNSHWINAASGDKFVCRGPDFLLRAYASALRVTGGQVRVTLRGSPKLKSIRPKVLHFGESYVVANTFAAQHSRIIV
jgi:hypothetical protein